MIATSEFNELRIIKLTKNDFNFRRFGVSIVSSESI